MGDLSPNFSRHEFACKCGCGFDTVDVATLELLEKIRSDCEDNPITINSGCRCAQYNQRVGGSKASQHMLGRAADFTAKSVNPNDVHRFVESILDGTGGLGAYNTFTHVDTRSNGPARWGG